MSAGSKEEFKARMAEAAAGRPQHASFARMDSFATPTKSFGSTRGSGLDRPRLVPARVELRLQDRRSSRADLVHAPRSRAEQEQLERELKMNTEQLTKEELLKTVQEEVRIRSRAFSGVRAWMLACVRVCMRDA